MTTRCVTRATLALLLLMTGCSKNSGEDPGASSPPPAEAPPPGSTTERPSLTRAECEAKGGKVVGDIGDGAIHRPDYTCESGEPPMGSIRAADGEPIAVEGEVCCP